MSAMSQTNLYHLYNELKNGKMSEELMGGPGIFATALTEQ